jgi:aminoglycoside phosphotransferase
MTFDHPLLRDARAVRRLPGLSGAEVFLLTTDERNWFVRKAARDVEGSARLRMQIEKQRAFGRRVGHLMHTPEVLAEGDIDGKYYVDLQFVRGTDGATYLRRASYGDVVALAEKIEEYVRVAATEPCVAKSAAPSLFEATHQKLCHIQRRTSLLSNDTLARLFLALDTLRSTARHEPTLCHGDFTLENFIIDERGNLTVLDLLDAPFEHYWQDVAKLHQDLAGGWYERNQPRISACVLEYLSRRLVAAVSRLDSSYAGVHALLVACTFARILPYAKSAAEIAFVRERVDHFSKLAQDRATGAGE